MCVCVCLCVCVCARVCASYLYMCVYSSPDWLPRHPLAPSDHSQRKTCTGWDHQLISPPQLTFIHSTHSILSLSILPTPSPRSLHPLLSTPQPLHALHSIHSILSHSTHFSPPLSHHTHSTSPTHFSSIGPRRSSPGSSSFSGSAVSTVVLTMARKKPLEATLCV